jgi:hypothetical protein
MERTKHAAITLSMVRSQELWDPPAANEFQIVQRELDTFTPDS